MHRRIVDHQAPARLPLPLPPPFPSPSPPSLSLSHRTLPFAPPMLRGSCAATQSVWQICVLPVRNSPKISVMACVSMPPAWQFGKVYG